MQYKKTGTGLYRRAEKTDFPPASSETGACSQALNAGVFVMILPRFFNMISFLHKLSGRKAYALQPPSLTFNGSFMLLGFYCRKMYSNQYLDHSVAHLRRTDLLTALRIDIRRTQPALQHLFDRRLDRIGCGRFIQRITQHHAR